VTIVFKDLVFTFEILNDFAGIGLAGVVEYFQGRWLRSSASVFRAVFDDDVEYLAVIIWQSQSVNRKSRGSYFRTSLFLDYVVFYLLYSDSL
jgi:hypothetical protein